MTLKNRLGLIIFIIFSQMFVSNSFDNVSSPKDIIVITIMVLSAMAFMWIGEKTND